MSEAKMERAERVESWVLYAVTDTNEAITDVETAIGFADGSTRERLLRVKSALKEAAAHLDTIYPGGLHSVKA